MFKFFAKKILKEVVVELKPDKVYLLFMNTQEDAEKANELFMELFSGMAKKPRVVMIIGEGYSKIKVVTIE